MEKFVNEILENIFEQVERFLEDYTTIPMPEGKEIREKAVEFLEQEGYTSINTAAIMISLSFEADGGEFTRIMYDRESWKRNVLEFAAYIINGYIPPYTYNRCEILDRDPDDPSIGTDFGFDWFEKPVEFSPENIYEMLNR